MYFWGNGAEATTSPGVSSLSFLGNSVAETGEGRDKCVVAQIVDENSFLAVAGEWTRLHTNSTFPSPFTSWEWCWAWWRHFGAGRKLRIATVRDGSGDLVAVAPLYVTSERSPFLSRELRIIGDDGRDGEGMTDEPTLLLGIDCRREAVEALLRHVHSGTGSVGWDAGKLRVPTSRSIVDVDVADTVPILPSWRIRWEEGSQVVSLPNSWPEFRRSLSRSMKDNLSYYPRRLQKHGHSFSVQLVRDTEGVREAVAVLAHLHNKRANNERGAYHGTHIPGDKHVAFLCESLSTLADLGMASIAIMKVGGEVVAAQAMLESPRTAIRGRELVLYYSGYCSAWHDYSPITILGAMAIEDAINRGVDRVNFLPGEMMWKTRWGTSEQGLIADFRSLRSRPASLARVFLRSAFRQAAMRRLI